MKHSGIGSLALVAALFAAPAMSADEEIDNPAAEYRQSYMKSIGGHFGAIANLVRGRVEHEGDLALHAEAVAKLAEDIVKLFPEGSGVGETDAKPEIWERWDEFAEKAEATDTAAAAFAKAVAGGDAKAIGGAFRDVGKSCKGCHDDFKASD